MWQGQLAPPPPPPLLRLAAGPFGGLFGGGSSSSSSDTDSSSRTSSSSSSGSSPEEEEEEGEGAEMVQLDASSSGSLDGSSEEPFGELALLAVGFTQLEFDRLRRLLHEDMEAEMVKVRLPSPCSPALLARSAFAAAAASSPLLQ